MTDVRAPVQERNVATSVHGRYLVRTPHAEGPWPLLVGFHGYAEVAETHLDALARLPGTEQWLLVAVQALHPFYTRERRIVASWMTRQGRDQAIDDNTAYVGRVLEAVRREFQVARPLVFSGFSQGGAMAYRAAARYPCDGIVVLAADVPPDVRDSGAPLPPVLLGRGSSDAWYTEEKHTVDLRALEALNCVVEACVFEGGHEWGDEFNRAAGAFLTRRLQST